MTTTNYDKQARDLMKAVGIELAIKKSAIQSAPRWAKNGIHGFRYDCTIKTTRGAYTFEFWDSIYNKQKGKRPTEYDVLASLMVWEGNIDDFVSEFGYSDTPTSEVLDTYNAVVEQSENLRHVLNTKQLAVLEEIR